MLSLTMQWLHIAVAANEPYGLAHLPDAFTAGDMSFIACYLCTC